MIAAANPFNVKWRRRDAVVLERLPDAPSKNLTLSLCSLCRRRPSSARRVHVVSSWPCWNRCQRCSLSLRPTPVQQHKSPGEVGNVGLVIFSVTNQRPARILGFVNALTSIVEIALMTDVSRQRSTATMEEERCWNDDLRITSPWTCPRQAILSNAWVFSIIEELFARYSDWPLEVHKYIFEFKDLPNRKGDRTVDVMKQIQPQTVSNGKSTYHDSPSLPAGRHIVDRRS